MQDGAVRLKVVTETWGNRTITIGKAFMNKKGIDGELWALPIPNAQGKLKFRLVEEDGGRSLGANLRLKVLLPRDYKDRSGEDKTQWNLIGFAVMQDGIDGELLVLPMPNREGGIVRFVMREDDGRPAQAQGGYQAPHGQGAGKFARQPQAPQERPQAPQGGFQGGGLRPQHRDGLAGPQGAVYGGAAAQQPADQGGAAAEDDLPFSPVDSRLL